MVVLRSDPIVVVVGLLVVDSAEVAPVVVLWVVVVLVEVVVVEPEVVDLCLRGWYLVFLSLLLMLLDSLILILGSEVTMLTISLDLCCLLVEDSRDKSSGTSVVASDTSAALLIFWVVVPSAILHTFKNNQYSDSEIDLFG